MKSVTSNYSAESRKLAGAIPIKLVKVFYGASSSFLASDRYLTIGSDVYNPWVKSISQIGYSLPNLAGLGKRGNCDIDLIRNSTTDNLLTGISRGKTVQVWQWFEGLTDSDKNILATFVIEEIVNVTQSTFTLRCISKESKLEKMAVNKPFIETEFPYMPDTNSGVPKPIVFGDFMYKKSNGDPYEGSSYPLLNRQQEYVQCKRPNRIPVPAFWTDQKLKIFLAHQSANSLAIVVDTGTQLAGQELMRYYSDTGLYGFCRNENASFPGKAWLATGTTGNTNVEKNFYSNSATVTGGQSVTLYILGDRDSAHNNVASFYNAIDTDPTTVATISNGETLGIAFKGNQIPQGAEAAGIKRFISFTVKSLDTAATLTVYYSKDSGANYTSVGTITGPITGSGEYREIQTSFHLDANSDFLNTNGYWIKITSSGGSGLIDGLAEKIIFRDEEDDSTLMTFFAITTGTSAYYGGPMYVHRVEQKEPTFTNAFFFNTAGVSYDVDGKAYDYRHFVYIIQYILRQVLGYTSGELGYSSIGNTYTTLSNWFYANSLNEFNDGQSWLEQILKEAQCYMWWGAEGFWQLMPVNYSYFLTTNIRIFSDRNSDPSLSPAMILPMSNFKWIRTKEIYNRFVFNYDFEFASGKFREQIIYDKNNKTELATSVTDYGLEAEFPIRDWKWIRTSTQIDNIYAVLSKRWKDPIIEIEFDTTLCASHLEVGDNIKVDHTAQTWAAPTSTTGKEFQITEHTQEGNRIHIKAVEIIP